MTPSEVLRILDLLTQEGWTKDEIMDLIGAAEEEK